MSSHSNCTSQLISDRIGLLRELNWITWWRKSPIITQPAVSSCQTKKQTRPWPTFVSTKYIENGGWLWGNVRKWGKCKISLVSRAYITQNHIPNHHHDQNNDHNYHNAPRLPFNVLMWITGNYYDCIKWHVNKHFVYVSAYVELNIFLVLLILHNLTSTRLEHFFSQNKNQFPFKPVE